MNTLLAQRKIPTEIVFYDEILDRMIGNYSIARKDCYSRPGWCFVSHIYLAPEQIHQRAFLAQYGNADSDRISVYLEGGEIIFECCDSQQKLHRLSSPIGGLGPHYVRFEFSNDHDGTYMSLNMNNVETDLRFGKKLLNLSPDIETFTFGADSNGAYGAHFFMLEHYAVSRTMDIAEKLGSFYYFEKKINAQSYCLELKPQSYMVRRSAGLVQEQDQFKPFLRAWPLSLELP